VTRAGENTLRLMLAPIERPLSDPAVTEIVINRPGEVGVETREGWTWFDAPERASRKATVICGHWSALGLEIRSNLIALDTGCLWGGSLTAVRLEDRKVFQMDCGAGGATRRWQ